MPNYERLSHIHGNRRFTGRQAVEGSETGSQRLADIDHLLAQSKPTDAETLNQSLFSTATVKSMIRAFFTGKL